VAAYLLGSLSEADLFTAAASADPKTDRGQHCEAWFYVGMKKLLAGMSLPPPSALKNAWQRKKGRSPNTNFPKEN
jgi:hypothetical protein